MVTATGTARRRTGDAWLDALAATEEAELRRYDRLVLEDRVQRLNRQLLGPRKDSVTGEWSKKHRAGTCGLAHSGQVEMGYVTVPDGLDAGQLRGVEVCAVGNLCLRCGIKIAAARARQIETANEVGGQVLFGEPKTKASRRRVSMPKFVAEELAAHLAGRAPVDPGDLVFTSPGVRRCDASTSGLGCGCRQSGGPVWRI